MNNIYYLIWVDSILSFKKHNPDKKNWKIYVFIINTYINALNFWIIAIWAKYFGLYSIPDIELNIFPGTKLNDILSFFVIFASPFGILNYFLIFHNDRYKLLIEKYGKPKGKYVVIYSMVILALAFFSAVGYGILTHSI